MLADSRQLLSKSEATVHQHRVSRGRKSCVRVYVCVKEKNDRTTRIRGTSALMSCVSVCLCCSDRFVTVVMEWHSP